VIVTLPTAPKLVVPETLSVPNTLAPVPVTVIMLALPTALNVIFPLAVAIFTLLLPLLIDDPPPADCAIQDRFEEPSVLNTYPLVPPDILTLPGAPRLLTPVTDKLAVIDTFDPAILPEEASSVIGPVVRPFFTTKFFV
jgi:hypothetical protein